MILAKILLFKGERKRCDVTDLFYHRVVCWGKVQRERGGGGDGRFLLQCLQE